MNIEKLKNYWYPMLFSKELKNRPISKKLLGVPFVLTRFENEVVCFENSCPHRNVPLNIGNMQNNRLVCGYHGWEFDKNGKLDKIPGCTNCQKEINLKKFSTYEIDGLIWIKIYGEKEFKNPFKTPKNYSSIIKIKYLKSDFIHTIENFLDPTHTPFIHKGLLRTEGRQKMQITQKSDNNSFETNYRLIDRQNGWINSLFDNGIETNIASFEIPGYAKIEYLKKEILLFEVAIFFTPIDRGEVSMVIQVTLQKTTLPSSIKFLLLQPFLELAFYQDKKILQTQYKTQQKLKKEYQNSSVDLVIDHLLYLLSNSKKGVDKKLDIVL